jgi:hypothetical protein
MFPNAQDALPLPRKTSLEAYKKLVQELVQACKTDKLDKWSDRWVRNLAKKSGVKFTRQLPVAVHPWTKKLAAFTRTTLADNGCNRGTAQLILARSHGFESWAKLSSHLRGINSKHSPTQMFESAVEAIIRGNLTGLKRLLRQNPRLVQLRSNREHQATLLHYVSANGVEGYRQQTPKNIVKITEELLSAGAEVNAEADVYGGGATTLGLVATSIHPYLAGVQNPLMQVLLDHGAEIDHQTSAGNQQNAVLGCLANGRGEAAVYLADRGAKLDLEAAAGVGRLDVVRNFFDKNGKLKRGTTK